MQDIDSIYTKRGTPLIVVLSRVAFAVYFTLALAAVLLKWFPNSLLNIYWLGYLAIMYLLAERVAKAFLRKGVDLSFAYPLLFAIYVLHGVSLLIRGQEHIPIINRAEHFSSFVLIGFIVWVFFQKYLPQGVWKKHPYYTAILVLSVTALAGVGNEITELMLDRMLGTAAVGTGYDTSIDLLMNTLGSGTYLAVRLILHEGYVYRL